MDLRKMHNTVKRDLIESLGPVDIVLDAGCGCGGDLLKWNSKSVVFACDPNNESLKEARKRKTHAKAVHFFNGDISNTPVQPYDAICYNFSIQYIFASRELFTKTIENIAKRSKIGTKLIGVVPDSEELILHGKLQNPTGNFNDSVSFFVEGAPYYKNGPVDEPVCYKEILITELEKIGFTLEFWSPLVSFATGTITDLYSKFLFVKYK